MAKELQRQRELLKAYDSEDVSEESEEEQKQPPQVSDKAVAQQLAQGMGIKIPKSRLVTNVSAPPAEKAKPAAAQLLAAAPEQNIIPAPETNVND